MEAIKPVHSGPHGHVLVLTNRTDQAARLRPLGCPAGREILADAFVQCSDCAQAVVAAGATALMIVAFCQLTWKEHPKPWLFFARSGGLSSPTCEACLLGIRLWMCSPLKKEIKGTGSRSRTKCLGLASSKAANQGKPACAKSWCPRSSNG